jgi:hypothetical protein
MTDRIRFLSHEGKQILVTVRLLRSRRFADRNTATLLEVLVATKIAAIPRLDPADA